jgi:hypothetical protein
LVKINNIGDPSVSNSPIDMLKNRMAGAVMNAVSDVATSAVTEGTELVKNGLKTKINELVNGKQEVVSNPKEEDEEEVEYEDSESPIPIAFDAFDKEKNLECAVAVWKLWGIRDSELDEEDLTEEPDIIAQFKNGLAFVGSMTELADFCEHNDLDEDVEVYGLNEDEEYDSSEIDSIKVSRTIMQYVTSYLATVDISDSEEMFKGFHWDNDATVTKVVKHIPFMENTPLTMCGVAQAIIYTAKKDGQVQTYIHEFGEDSGEKPIMYALPTPEGEKWPRSILIHGGNMRVENRGIVD